MQYFKLYETFTLVENPFPKSKVQTICYHASDKELNPSNLHVPSFYTSDKDGVDWYVDRLEGTGWLTTAYLNIEKPIAFSHEVLVDILLPILDKNNIQYDYSPPLEYGWSFNCREIEKRGGHLSDNVLDLIYIKEVVSELMRMGYDGIIDWDVLERYEIEVQIPFYKENIHILSSVKPKSRWID